jgi:hypothetical protein
VASVLLYKNIYVRTGKSSHPPVIELRCIVFATKSHIRLDVDS